MLVLNVFAIYFGFLFSELFKIFHLLNLFLTLQEVFKGAAGFPDLFLSMFIKHNFKLL